MNIILIVSDTLRRDHLGCYGNNWISTPNIDRFSKNSLTFEDAYIGSFPTVPHRRDLFTGRFTFTYCDWSPLTPDEIVLSEVLAKAGYLSMFIADTPHTTSPGYNYQRGFSGWLTIRGQEGDLIVTNPADIKLPASPEKLREPKRVKQMMRNNLLRNSEEDYFCAQTMREAEKWLEKNYRKKFFLYVDTFDPHEPWDPPHYYVDLYDQGYQGEEVIYPVYGPSDYLTEGEMRHIRAHYAAEVTLVDRWVGKLFQKIEDLDLFKNSVVVFTTDHGFLHGEHGLIGKSIITKNYQSLAPLYEEISHIPLIIHLPKTQPSRVSGFVQPPDITTTLIELAEAETPGVMNGKSILPLIEGKRKIRDFVVSAPSIIYGSAGGQRVTITTKDWTFIYGLKEQKDGQYETKIVDGKVRIQKKLGKKIEPELYYLPSDPRQEKNVFIKNKDTARRLRGKFIKFLESVHTEEKILKPWRIEKI